MQENKLRVLIIEDERIFRSLVMQVFEGCDKLSAATAADGLAKFKEFCPDITLLDIGLPDKNGLDLLPELINYDPEAFIVMLTMSRISKDVKLSKERGAAGYIIKPFTFQKVADCLTKYKEYKKALQLMTPEERAGNIITNLKVEALHDDLNKQIVEDDSKIATKQNHLPQDATKIEILLQSWNIMFADNYLVNRERAELQLKKLGSHIELAQSSAEVIKKSRIKPYNIILMDSQISGIGGYETAKLIRKYEEETEAQEKVILIVMVENTDELDKLLWQKAGMNDFIKKPARFTKIREIIQKLVKRQLDMTKEEYTT